MDNKKTRTSIYISEAVKAEAENMAKAENRTLSNFIETMIKERASKEAKANGRQD